MGDVWQAGESVVRKSFKLFPNQTVRNTQCLASAQKDLPFYLWNNGDDNSILWKEKRERGENKRQRRAV